MFRLLLLASALALLSACASNPEPMRTGISPNPRYHPPDPNGSVVNGSNPTIVGESAWQSEAAKWIGAPYRPGGKDRTGTDDLGLIQQMYENVARIKLSSGLDELSRTGVAIPRDQLRPGDIVFFGKSSDKVYVGGDTHVLKNQSVGRVGIYLGDNKIVQAIPRFGVAYAQLSDPQFADTYRTARRILR